MNPTIIITEIWKFDHLLQLPIGIRQVVKRRGAVAEAAEPEAPAAVKGVVSQCDRIC